MEPSIQYAQTKDGVSIAYWTLGEGPAVLLTTGIFGSIEMSSVIPIARRVTEALVTSGRRVIRYDGRGQGSSDRRATDFSLDARVRDLEAVVDRLGVDRFALWGNGHGGPTAVVYALHNRDRVSHLILTATFTSGEEFYQATPMLRAMRAMRSLAEEEWELFTRTVAQTVSEFRDPELADQMAEIMRTSMSRDATLLFRDATNKINITELLPEVSAPTLVIHSRASPLSSFELSQELASRIPDARFVASDDPANTIVDFLGPVELETAVTDRAASEVPEGMAVILFADIANSTALTEQLGDAAFRDKARELDTSLRSIIGESGGTPVEGKVLGDGVLAVFTSARQAIECALRCNAASEPLELQLHLGIHAGDVIREGNNVYGGAVNIAARIAGVSAPGEALVSDTVRSLARTSAGVAFDDRGEQSLKGVADPQRLFAVRGGE